MVSVTAFCKLSFGFELFLCPDISDSSQDLLEALSSLSALLPLYDAKVSLSVSTVVSSPAPRPTAPNCAQ